MNIASLYGHPLAVAAKLAPPAQAELDRLQTELDTLHRQHAGLTFDVATAVPGSVSALVEWREKLKAAQEAVADARLVLQVAQQKDAEVEQRKHAAAFQGRVASLKQHLSRREKAAMAISNHVQNLCHEWRSLIAVGEKIDALVGSENLRNEGAMGTHASLSGLLQDELFRLGSGAQSSNGQFPHRIVGASPSDFRITPTAMPTLLDRVKQSSAWILAQLERPTAAPPAEPSPVTAPKPGAVQTPSQPADVAVMVPSDDAKFRVLSRTQGTTDGNQVFLPPVKMS